VKKLKYDNVMKLDFLSKSTNESFARVAVAAFVSQLDPTIEEISDIKTAVSEAVTNAIVHGYENKIGIITIHVHIKEREITIQVKDRGNGIEDVQKAMQPLFTTDAANERSGMGFSVMETFTDRLFVNSRIGKGTRVIMKKRLS
jgi:stage II sporulation protein AB (anti-sigma F factor)